VRTFPRGRLPLGPEQGLQRGPEVTLLLDGNPARAYAGETVAAVLIAEEGLRTRRTAGGAARGVYCGMGVCFDCLVVVDGVPNTRACMTLVAKGMRVERQTGWGRSV
jgi:hypothetical protein